MVVLSNICSIVFGTCIKIEDVKNQNETLSFMVKILGYV